MERAKKFIPQREVRRTEKSSSEVVGPGRRWTSFGFSSALCPRLRSSNMANVGTMARAALAARCGPRVQASSAGSSVPAAAAATCRAASTPKGSLLRSTAPRLALRRAAAAAAPRAWRRTAAAPRASSGGFADQRG
jgi:hypothetical protein